MKKIRILLADDHSLVRIGLTTLLNTQPDLAVVGEAQDGDEAVALYERLEPDVVIMDLMMSGTDGAEATRLFGKAVWYLPYAALIGSIRFFRAA